MNNEKTTPPVADAGPSAGLDGAGTQPAPVSVLIPCFRCAETILDAVASVAAQTLRPAEVLLVDDGSGDDTLAALHRVASAYEPGWIKVIALPTNGGVSRARNAGWQRAGQPYIALLDADDSWGPRKLELQMAALQADPSIALIGHLMVERMRGTPVPEPRPPVLTQNITRRELLLHNPFPAASVVLRRDLPFRFDEDFRRSEDFLLWSQILLSGHRCARINQVLAIWNAREPGVSGLSDDRPAMRRTRRDARHKLVRQGLLSRSEYWFSRACDVLLGLRRDLTLRLRRQGPYRPGLA
jgi:glycosyltransferase involved in cell wall biosynthesis